MMHFPALSSHARPIRVGVLGFDGVAGLDMAGPLESFARAQSLDDQKACYEVLVLSLRGKAFVSESGVAIRAHANVGSAPTLDTIVIPGGNGLRDRETISSISGWLCAQAARTRRMVAVSTGIYPLAKTTLLDGRHVTTHWRCAPDIARRFPQLRINYTASFVKDGAFYTCGGGTACLEMTVALINEDYGPRVALDLAREFVVRLRPPGQDESCPDLSSYQSGAFERLADLPSWIVAHIDGNLSVEELAKRACLCPRQFGRVFKSLFKSTPADFVEQLRLREACRRLKLSRNSVESIAASVGFRSDRSFRRAFERRLGVSPTKFRKRSDAFHDKLFPMLEGNEHIVELTPATQTN